MKHLSKILFILMLSFTIFSCGDDTPAPVVVPIISGFTPGNGPVTTQITIFGANFGTSPTVKFGSIDATVISSTAVQIVTTVPTGATTGKISVTTGGQTATSTSDFVVGGLPQVIKGTGPAGTITNITANETWTAGNRYLLRGLVVINDGVTLTIQPGTVIFGDKATRGGLIVARGGKLIADGTAANPIVFTSSQPAGERSYGDWIGILIAGKAVNNQSANQQFEGLPNDTKFQYGIGTGADTPMDNSGTLRYVRIEFSGIAISDGNETNGLTLGSVGSGTILEFIQVSFCGDDSYEWFGGTVDAKNIIAFRGWDDDFDVDFGHSGRVQFGLGLRDPFIADQSQSNGFETDNNSTGSAATPITSAVFSNITYVGGERGSRGSGSANNVNNANYGRALHIRRNSSLSVFNSVFIGSVLAGLSLDGTAVQSKFETATADAIQFRGNVFSVARTTSLPARGGFFAFEGGSGFSEPIVDAQTAFNNNNTINTDVSTLGIANLVAFANITSPTLLPTAGSTLLGSSPVFTGKANNTYFNTTLTYKGAFGATNWATGWTNFDPQNTAY
jgi:hypothetical protein